MQGQKTTEKQARHPAVAPILDSCVRYGFCTNTCPTYVLTRDENESPRGRIALIGDMLASDTAPGRDTVAHIDSCLGCLSCMTTCAAKVDYHHLIDYARDHVERTYRRPWRDRFVRRMLAFLMPSPSRFRAALRLAPLGWTVRWTDRRLAAMLDLRPAATPAAPDLGRARRVHPAEGTRRGRVVLLTGCVQRVIARHVNDAAVRMLCRHGVEVVVLPQVDCCGALTLHMGFGSQARRSAAALAGAIAREHADDPIDAVIITASGCGTTIKDYARLLGDEADHAAAGALTAGLARDVTEYLSGLALNAPVDTVRGIRVAYHDACSLQHGQKVTRQPRALLKDAGFVPVNAPEGHICCGSAGTYNLLQPDTAHKLGQRKAEALQSTGAAVVAAGNLGCITQIAHHADLPVVHTVELLDWATGGPVPPALAGRELPREALPDPLPENPAPVADAPASDDSFW